MEGIKDKLTPEALGQFTGTMQYYKHWTGSLVYTDGVQFLGANGAYWIIDLVASYQTADLLAKVPFQVWKVTRTKAGGFLAVLEDGNGGEVLRQEGEYTDLPIDIDVWVQADATFKAVAMLPSEY